MTSQRRVSAARTALLVVDVQGAVPEIGYGTERVLDRLATALARARAAGAPVVFTRQRYGDRVPEIVSALGPVAGESVIDKDAPDAFLGTPLMEIVIRAKVTTIAIAGFATEACIDSTARAALSRDFDLILLSDCHTTTHDRGIDPNGAEAVIAHYNATFSRIEYPGRTIRVMSSDEIVFEPSR